MNRIIFSPIKSTLCFVLFFFLIGTTEATCFYRHQLFKMQNSSYMDIHNFLKMEGWDLAELNSIIESNSDLSFTKSSFPKNYGERVVIYFSRSYGNIIHMELSPSCFQTISLNEFGNLNKKFHVEQNKIIKEHQYGNQIIQLVEYASTELTNPEILIFNEELKNQVNFLISQPQELKIEERIEERIEEIDLRYNVEKEKADEIFELVDEQPIFPGGMEGWNKYLSDNLIYPTQARRMGVEGTVIVVFVINTDGSIQDVEVLRGIGGGCDEVVINLVKNSPNWEPGKHRGRPVRTRMRLPMKFKLG